VPVLVDREGLPLAVPPEAGPLTGLLERLRQLDGAWREVAAGDRVVAVGTVPLTDRNGQAIGARRWITDVTEESWGRARDDLASAMALVALVALATLAGLFWLRRAFRPLELVLAAQVALAEGDLTVELPGQDRADEIGGAVRALLVFRQGRIALRRRARADAWQRQVRLRFIEEQLGRLAATLDDGDRAAMEDDLRALLAAAHGAHPGGGDAAGMDALAKAFRALAERVRSQHGKLRRLIAEQGDALAARHRVERLEQELAAVARMQMRLVPPAMPGETGAAVEGRLIQGSQFGGDFQDFFWLDGPGGRRLAVFAASVRGTGLDAAFLAISARALVRSLAPVMPTPGACLSRVSDLLLGDNEQRMEIGAFLGVIDLGAQVLVAARAAAPPPVLLLRAGEARPLEVPAAPPLGLQPHLKVPDVTIDLPARAALVAFSHGVPDTVLRGAPLGLHGVVEMLAASPGLDPGTVLDHAGARLVGAGATRPGDASLLVARLQGTA
jgi:serine phosphatase RsbU (regulator of sigma subunit)/HAMP domain-containing protein